MKRVVFLSFIIAMLASAQDAGVFAWWDSPIARNLNLTEQQQKQVRSIVREFRDRLIEQRAAVQKAEGNFRDLMNEDPVNEARAREAIDRLVEARGELMRTLSQMALRMRTVLTAEQWQRVQRRAGQLAQQERLRRQGEPAPPPNVRPRRVAPRGPVF